ncbi:MAG: type II secretion system protein GspN [Kofleriaceae bacterium]|nr:type II secretion system protein GspN [Kofleriaceae bacterium]MBP9167205.1 type II secretion system protein GspN [Kofleriaceae bacterium]MBP9861136.1 type II secretion system protein GspN [Kofleriaceae bacterium]
MAMSPRLRLGLRVFGYVALALVTFVFALHLTFPYERVRDQALHALSSKYDVTIGGVERSWVPGRFALTAVTLRSRPSVAGQPSTTMYFKRVEIDLGFRALLAGKTEIGLDIATGTGSIAGAVVIDKRSFAVDFKLTKVPMTMIPGVSDAVGLPMSGNADGKIKLVLTKVAGRQDIDWAKANGVFELACKSGCLLGDGQAKLYPKSKRPGDEAWTKDGVIVPTLRIGSFNLAIDIVKGVAKKRAFTLNSPDGEVGLELEIKLARNLNDSPIAGCIKYKCSKELYDREPKFRSQCDFGSAVIDADGMHHIKLMGKLSNVRRVALACDGGSGGDAASTEPIRPRLDTPPPEPTPPPPPIGVEIDAGIGQIDPSGILPPQPMRDDVGKPPEVPPEVTPPPVMPGSNGAAPTVPVQLEGADALKPTSEALKNRGDDQGGKGDGPAPSADQPIVK